MELTEAQIQKQCITFIDDAQQHTSMRDQRDRAEKHQDFFRGGTHQWTQEEYDTYKSRGVEPITINRCKPIVKSLLGMYLQSRQEVRVRPRRGGSSTVAQVHTETLKHCQDVSYADYVYAQAFMRGGIDTESYLKLEIDMAANVNGQPIIKPRSIFDIQVDRNAVEYDLNESAKYIIERQWMDCDELKALYPGRDDELAKAFESVDSLESKPAERLAKWMTQEGETVSGGDDEGEQIPDMELLRKYRYLTHECWWKAITPALIVGDTQTGQTTIVTEEKQVLKLVRKGKKSVRFVLTPYANKVLHKTVMMGGLMLEDKPEPFGKGMNDYPIVRFSPLLDEGYAIGFLDDAVSLNREENIHRTQTIRILNQTANSGWLVGSDNNKPYVRILKNFGSVPGIVLPKDKFGNYIEKIQPNQLPVGHFTMGKQFEQDIKRTSGVDDATQGYTTGQSESGRAINLKMQSNRQASEIFFDNWYHTLEIFGTLLLKVNMASNFYNDDEIKAIVEESSLIDMRLMAKAKAVMTGQMFGADLPQPQPLPPVNPQVLQLAEPMTRMKIMQQMQAGVKGAQEYAKAYPQLAQTFEGAIREQAKEMLLRELRQDKGLYGVKVSVSPSAPTERLAQFMQMDALMTKYGQLIPPDIFIDMTELPEAKKEEIKARIHQQAQAQMRPQPQQGVKAA
ncbi:MAG: hypothetical protein ABIF19_14280 [Planctomycetota bacterium]